MDQKKSIWIIGASRGIGKSLAIHLSQQGHHLILSSRTRENLEDLKKEHIPGATIILLDVKNSHDIQNAYHEIKQFPMSLDSVVLISGEYEPMAVDKFDLEKCRTIIETNLMPAFTLINTVCADFTTRGQGQIILCGSVAGYRGLPNGQPYSSTKAALINLAETARIELSTKGIDVKIINPGFVKTDMTEKNTFSMPMLISPDLAAKRIIKQMFDPHKFEIKTHPFFTFLMGCLRIMPFKLYTRLAKRMI